MIYGEKGRRHSAGDNTCNQTRQCKSRGMLGEGQAARGREKKGHATKSLMTSDREFCYRNRAAETQETQPCPSSQVEESKRNLLAQFDNTPQKPGGL